MKVHHDPRVGKIIESLPMKDNSRVVQLVDLFEQYGFVLPQHYLKKLIPGIWELRSGRWRLLFGVVGQEAISLNLFLKQTQKTPKKEIDLALQRLKGYI